MAISTLLCRKSVVELIRLVKWYKRPLLYSMNDNESTMPQNTGKLWVRYIICKTYITCRRSYLTLSLSGFCCKLPFAVLTLTCYISWWPSKMRCFVLQLKWNLKSKDCFSCRLLTLGEIVWWLLVIKLSAESLSWCLGTFNVVIRYFVSVVEG
jgi:hypothetical protein